MTTWLLIFGVIYLGFLAFSARRARAQNAGDALETLQGRSGIPTTLLFLSFSATLFSTFTLMGMPDFFRTHGVASWLFIGVTDVAMGFIVLWFGLRFRAVIEQENVRSVSALLRKRYSSSLSVWVYVGGVFVFLAPYVAIQIQGVSQLLSAIAPAGIPTWVWAVAMLLFIGVYSWIGGFRAIVYSDVAQGLILLAVIWLIAMAVIGDLGGIASIFDQVRVSNPELLTAPGPKGLMSFQFILASFLAILWMPLTQPQLTSRISVAKSDREIPLMAFGVSFFALLILVPVIFIGLGGSILHPDLPAGEFLANILVNDRNGIIGALAIVGLIAAAMSTADSQLFALGSEIQTARVGDEKKLRVTENRVFITLFALGSFILSQISSQELALLARISFAGTAIIGPMILLAVWSNTKLSIVTPVVAIISLVTFFFASLGVFQISIPGLRLDLGLMILTAIVALLEFAYIKMSRI